MNANPLSDREKALENQWIKEKEKQMAKERAAKGQADKDTGRCAEGQGQQQAAQEQNGNEPVMAIAVEDSKIPPSFQGRQTEQIAEQSAGPDDRVASQDTEREGKMWERRERLRNEAATLKFVAANTTIPVPGCQLYKSKYGLLHLELSRITDGVLLFDIEPGSRLVAVKAVEEQLQSDVLPQLRSLRRRFIGSVGASLPVFPPSRIYCLDRRSWPRISSDYDEFVLCHNDLGPQNIFVDPDTFKIVGIIDWKFAGFFPPYFELPLYREFE
ncbi:hypothetical protein VTK56DRAFT_3788 [Thermocarpiscus australiensis]